MFIIFWDTLIDEQVFFLPQVKRSVNIGNKHGIYKFSDKLLNESRNYESYEIRKCQENPKSC